MKQAKIDRIRVLAESFRSALEQMRGSLRCLNLERFPRGCCGNASPILGTFLTEHGCGKFDLIEGTRGLPEVDFRSHAWLRQGRVIVDITADQFEEVDETVIVTSYSPWHDSFNQRVGYSGDYRTVGNDDLTSIMGAVYEAVVDHIKSRS